MEVQQLKRHGEEVREAMLQEIINYIKEYGYAPSVREIGNMVGLKSTSSVYNHLQILRMEGKIETDHDYSPRAIRVPGYKFVKEDREDGIQNRG